MTSFARRLPFAHSMRITAPALDTVGLVLLLAPCIAFMVALAQPVDFDYWWHRRTGQFILEQRVFPRTDPFAFTTDGKAWVDHEWLAQVVTYGIDATLGYLALFAFFFTLGVAGWWLVYRLVRAEGLGRAQAAALSLAPLVFGAMHWRARPAMFTVFFLALFLHELFAARRGERRTLWHLAALMVLWSNLHGGYVIGLVVLALFAASSRFDERGGRGPAWTHAIAVLAVGFVLTGVNPYTWRIWMYPFTYFAGENASLRQIDEWQSPDFHELRSYPLAALLLLTALIGANGRRFDAWRSSLLVVFAALALQSMRHQTLFALVWTPVAGLALAERWPWWKREGISTGGIASVNWALFAGTMAAVVTAFTMSSHRIPLADPPTGGAMAYPADGAAYIERELPESRIFNEYTWGGYLIERLYPESRVFIDGRADLHGELVVEYDAIVKGNGWEDAFEHYGVDTALIPPFYPLARRLVEAGWRVAYRDDDEILLVAPGKD